MKVLDVQQIDGLFDVYDIEVDVDQSFLVEGCVLHNSQFCQYIDGEEFPVDSGPRPPFHVNCRTTFSAVLDERFDFLDKGATRRDRDPETGDVGYVPAKQTTFGWVKSQPAAVQNELIGPVRAKLLRDGGLSAQRFQELGLNRMTWKPRTIKDMMRIEPLAFQRAGIE